MAKLALLKNKLLEEIWNGREEALVKEWKLATDVNTREAKHAELLALNNVRTYAKRQLERLVKSDD